MRYAFDVIFVDSGPAEPYHRKTLEMSPMGGTEASLIRVAEGLGALGLNVAIIKAHDEQANIYWGDFEPIMGQHCYFLPHRFLSDSTTKHAVFLRGPLHIECFDGASKYVWLHDLPDKRIESWFKVMDEYEPILIAVSQWHRSEIKKFVREKDKVDYIYNPVDTNLFIEKPRERYDKNLMIWASSPHKGLSDALETFKKLRLEIPHIQLLTYNPGYVKINPIINPGVLYYGPTNCKNVWHTLRRALCLFYPSHFKETFGLVFAEANALGCPVVGYKDAGAINEIAQGAILDSEEEILSTTVKWHKEGLPSIMGNPDFRLDKVVMEWVKLFAGV